MTKHFYIATLFAFFLTNCQFAPEPKLTTIEGFPEETDGCSCYFAKNQADFDKQKFIYLDTYYEGAGFISINGELINIDLDNPDQNKFEVKIEFDSDEQNGDETWWKTGIITVTTKNGKTLKSNFVGECGC